MKVAGSSIEVGLSPFCGPKDVLTGTQYAREVLDKGFDYPEINNKISRIIEGDLAKKFLIGRGREDLITKEDIKVEIYDYKFHSHLATNKIDEIENKAGVDFLDYFKFTICRNPRDHVVSYFWWSFFDLEYLYYDEAGEPIVASKSTEFSKNGKYSYMMPHKDDSPTVLQKKLQSFLITESTFYHKTIDKDVNILDWFSNFSKDFYTSDIDYVIKFESLQSGFDEICDKLNIKKSVLPRIKTKSRKNKISYTEYYNDFTKSLVQKKFSKIIEQFDYSFIPK